MTPSTHEPPGLHPTVRMDVGGETMLAAEVDLRAIREWPATIQQMREAALARLVTGMNLSQWELPIEAALFTPRQREVENTGEMVFEAVAAGRVIDFGMLPGDAIKLGGRRGGPLFNQAALPQPFSQPWMFAHRWEHGSCFYLVNPTDGMTGDVEVVELQPVLAEGQRLLLIGDRCALYREADPEKRNQYHADTAPSPWRYMPGAKDVMNQAMDPQYAVAGNILDPLMTALLILNTRNVERETIAVSPKLNRARARNGKPPIPPYDLVHTGLYVTALMRGRRGRGEDQGGTHGAPVPHLRMGHPRVYRSGIRTLIQDTLVNVPPEVRAEFKSKRSHYTVQR